MLQPTQQSANAGVMTGLDQVQAQMNAQLSLSSTGGSLTADGTEQTLVIVNEPLGCWWPNVLFIDLDNMILGDTIIIRVYYRLSDAGTLKLWDSQTFTGLDGSLVNLAKILDITFMPNRHGFQVTLAQTAGTNRSFAWEFIAEV